MGVRGAGQGWGAEGAGGSGSLPSRVSCGTSEVANVHRATAAGGAWDPAAPSDARESVPELRPRVPVLACARTRGSDPALPTLSPPAGHRGN